MPAPYPACLEGGAFCPRRYRPVTSQPRATSGGGSAAQAARSSAQVPRQPAGHNRVSGTSEASTGTGRSPWTGCAAALRRARRWLTWHPWATPSPFLDFIADLLWDTVYPGRSRELLSQPLAAAI